MDHMFIPHRWKYDVFVSFRGEDIRKKFMDHMFNDFKQKGIHAFRDDRELPEGEYIPPHLYKAIEESRFLIVIFSKNYASSSWCLRELVKILECKQMGKPKHEVQIIFYDVKPDMVRKQTGSYAEAFAKHDVSNSREVDKWREALSMAANLSGWDLQDDANGYEYKFIDCISKDILKKLCDGPLHVGENLVGMDFHFDKLDLSRFVGSHKVNMLGICGISGIGKTTLAKAIYSLMYANFEGSCFCEDVRKQQDLTQVQMQLIDDIMKTRKLKISSVVQGIMVIKKVMSSKPILLVLDDVDHLDQLKALAGSASWFCPGSLIIFTGKDKQLLISHGVDEIHDMDFLDEDQSLKLFSFHAFEEKHPSACLSLKLFSFHAFEEKHPSACFQELAEKAVNYVQGHPLALIVLGCFLYGKSVGQWVSELERLKKHPNEEIHQVLRLSYDGLNLQQQNILLDIACLFVGENSDFVASILDGCNFFANTNMRVLVDKSLITISSNNSLQMHDLIQAMAREIIHEESIMSGKHRRLWNSSQVYNASSEKKVPITEEVEALVLSLEKSSQKVHIDANDFAHMKKLRILKIYQEEKPYEKKLELKGHNVIFSGNLYYLSNELSLLYWHGCPFKYLPSDFYPENIVAIDLSYSNIKNFWTTPKCFKRLKVMKLRYCCNLTTTPDFSEITNLEELSLEGCVNLVSVHPSIGILKRLAVLNLKGCVRLQKFPSGVEMDAFHVLNLTGLRMPLEDIKLATNNFSPENVITLGRDETVYIGVIFLQGKPLTVVLRLVNVSDMHLAADKILLLSRYHHPNIMFLLGFCIELHHKIILVYEYPAYGSLQNYLDNTNLTWKNRLNICISAARAISYLNKNFDSDFRFTSSSIFLDTNWEAKVFKEYFYDIDSVYSDPVINKTYIMTKDSNIYSLGIVLCEVLCGRLEFDAEYESDSQYLMKLVEQSYKEGTLDEIIDPFLKNQMAPDSLRTFLNIAYQCCNKSPMQRPNMHHILQELDQAVALQLEFEELALHVDDGVEGIPMVQDDYYKEKNLEHWIIPSKEIYSATNGFCNDHLIGGGGFGGVYKAKLFHFDVRKYGRINGSHNFSTGGGGFGGYPRRRSTVAIKKLDVKYGQGKREFLQEIEVLSRLKHRNLVSLLGFCDHDGDMILVYEHASNGSLDKCINNRRGVYSHTWAQRLQICLDVAHGLSYLHNLGIIHRDIKSANILLGRNLEGVIGDFGLSRTSKHQNVDFSMTNVAGTPAYIDPKYFRTGELTKQSDIYSFGVVLWEVLCGRLAMLPTIGDDQEYLLHLARRHFDKNELNLIIDPQLREEFDKSSSNPGNKNFEDSIKTFAAIAYACLDAKAKQLTMDDVVKELKKAWTFHVTGVEMLSLNTINSATSGFSEEHVIGNGTLGKVYIGALSVSMQPKVVAIKRLEMVGSYEEGGFFKDVAMMSSYIDDNIIPFHGFCEEANEMILVFEHATNRSLDKHLDNSTLTWRHRLKISIGIAHGLQYIHSCVQPRKAVHGDIKSSHILLDDVWKATISDFIISKCEGTLGYRDPEYQKTGVLTTHSDVYAFGVVLFELLSGRPAIEDVENDQQHTSSQIFNADPATSEERKDKVEKVVFLAQLATRCFEDRKVEAIIFHGIKEKADPISIDIFSAIAYQCLQQNKENRPTMARVIEELERAFKSHDEWEWEQKLPRDYKRITEMSKHPVPSSTTKKDLHCLLSSGVLLSKENVWFSISMHGVICEMVPSTKFLYGNASSLKWASIRKSRFPKVAKILDVLNLNIQIKIRPQFLTLEKTYGAYLVFTFCDPRNISCMPLYINLKYKKKGEALNTYFAQWKTENKWLMVELFRFVNKDQTTDFEVLLESFSRYYCGSWAIFIEGIEFRPVTVDAVVNKEIKDEKDVQGVYQSKSDMHLEEKLGNDYHEVINRSQSNPVNTSKEELNALLSKGILIDEGEKLFSVSKVSMKKCYMLSAKSVIYSSPNVKRSIRVPSSQSRCRFTEVLEILSHYEFRIKCNIETKLLSPNTKYGCFLVFQISEECRGLKGPVKGRNLLPHKNKETNIISFRNPSQMNLQYIKWIPAEREDGWMEVIMWEIHSENEQIAKYIPMDMKLTNFEGSMSGLIVCGIEFRPI